MLTQRMLMMAGLCLMLVWPLALPAAADSDDTSHEDHPTLRSDRARPDGARRMRGPRLAPEDVQEALEVLRDYRPELAEEIEQWRQQKPEDVISLIRQHMPWIGRLVETRRQDPDGYALRLADLQLHQQSKHLAERLQEARRQNNAQQVQALQQQLRQSVTEHFEVRQQIRQHALKRMEQTITRLRERLEARHAARDSLIDSRMEHLAPTDNDAATPADW